jgi:putative peptidoglycan lipid II flippase
MMTLLSRVSGQVRAILLVLAIGATGMVADAFDVANNIPASLNLILTGGIFNAILVPQFVKAKRFKNADERINKLLTLALCFMFAVTLILTVGASVAISVISSPQWTAQQFNLAVFFGFICMPQVFFYGLFTLLGQVLAAKERFGMLGFAPVVNNIVSCAVLVFYILLTGGQAGDGANINALTIGEVLLLGVGSTAGIAAQALILIIPLKRIKFKFRLVFGVHGFGLRKVAKLALYSFLSILIEQVSSLFIVSLVSGAPAEAAKRYNLAGEQLLAIGGNAAWSNALIIYIIPHSLITVSLVTALFTALTKQASKGNTTEVARQYIRGSCINIFAINFFTFLFIVLALPIVRTLIPSASQVGALAIATGVVALSTKLVVAGLSQMTTRVFFAYEKTKWYFLIDLPEQILQIALCLIAVAIVPPELWLFALGLASSVSLWLGTFACIFVVHKRILAGHADIKKITATLFKTSIAGGASGVVLHILQCAWTHQPVLSFPSIGFIGSSWPESLAQCVVGTLIMGAVYYAVCIMLRVPEAKELLDKLPRTILRRR